MSEPLRYILVGTGGRGAYWCRQVLPRLKELNKALPAALVDINPDRLKFAQDYLGVPAEHCYVDAAEAMAKRRADFVIIAVPTVHQEKIIDLALTFDLPILAEGPIAESMEKACRIYRKVRGIHKKKMAVTLGRRFEQDVQTLQRLIASRKLGRLHYVVARFTENCRKRGSWGRVQHDMFDPLLIDASMPHFDVFRGLCGGNVRSVYAVSWNPPWGEYNGDSTALVTLEMEDGTHGMYEGAKANAAALNVSDSEYFRVECEHATVEIDQRRIRALSGGGIWEQQQVKTEEIPLAEQPLWGSTWLAALFCEWLQGYSDPPNTLKDHMYVAATAFAAIESARTGKIVQVKEFLQRHVEASRNIASS